jgi:hypothetical protein
MKRSTIRALGPTPLLVLLAAASSLLAGCGRAAGGERGAIVCSTAYRNAVTEALTGTDTLRFGEEDSEKSLPYLYLELHGQYWTGAADNERALRLWVTPSGEESVIVSQLFQLPLESGPSNQFRGGHGFTGLNYAYDPVSGAELQYWCETAEAS